ncbi:hypothetical protein ACPYIV_05475 [Parabacteroides sp. ASD2025]|uniref:hypothetical protein n=1 Tax=Parabacteroides sp. ASD2025 TaxID=3415987 RepID=UPI0025EFAA06|nr:hypothetical protein [uncultured Parabacteroides sp.]
MEKQITSLLLANNSGNDLIQRIKELEDKIKWLRHNNRNMNMQKNKTLKDFLSIFISFLELQNYAPIICLKRLFSATCPKKEIPDNA